MQAKEILKEHIAKTALLTDDQFDYFFSLFKPESYKKGQAIISEGDKVFLPKARGVVAGIVQKLFNGSLQ